MRELHISRQDLRVALEADVVSPTRRSGPQRLDLLLLGATGFTGRQAADLLMRQDPNAHWGIACDDAARLQALADEMLSPGAREPRA